MNLKRIKVTQKMYKRISEIGVSKLKASTLQGVNEFKKFITKSISIFFSFGLDCTINNVIATNDYYQ